MRAMREAGATHSDRILELVLGPQRDVVLDDLDRALDVAFARKQERPQAAIFERVFDFGRGERHLQIAHSRFLPRDRTERQDTQRIRKTSMDLFLGDIVIGFRGGLRVGRLGVNRLELALRIRFALALSMSAQYETRLRDSLHHFPTQNRAVDLRIAHDAMVASITDVVEAGT